MPKENKRGRPNKWVISTKIIRVPKKYADALMEIALEWQQNEIPEN